MHYAVLWRSEGPPGGFATGDAAVVGFSNFFSRVKGVVGQNAGSAGESRRVDKEIVGRIERAIAHLDAEGQRAVAGVVERASCDCVDARAQGDHSGPVAA